MGNEAACALAICLVVLLAVVHPFFTSLRSSSFPIPPAPPLISSIYLDLLGQSLTLRESSSSRALLQSFLITLRLPEDGAKGVLGEHHVKIYWDNTLLR